MKKLLIAMMSVASLAFISKADAINSGTTFENYTGAFGADKDDRGGNDGTFWYTAGSQSDCGTLTNIDYTASYTGERPAIAQDAPTATALAVEAEQRLERGIANYSGGFAPQDIGSGIYFDTMVQFTATDTAPTPSQDDKLIVWLYGSAEEDGAFGIGTNLVVTAGYLSDSSNTAVPSNYVVTTASAIEPNTWHRLTIKSIKSITTDGSKVAGFVVFIDGVAVATEDAKGVEGSAMSSLNATAAKWNNTNNLFPSLVTKKDSAESLSAVALEGIGMIDDISFTSTAPAFAADAPTVVISWGDGVDSVQYKVGSGSFVDVVNGATITLESAGTITVAANYANGYVADTWLFNGAETTETSFAVSAPSTIEIAAKQQLITAGGETFASVEALVAWLNSEAQSGFEGTIQLLGDVNVGKVAEDYVEILTVQQGQNVTLDLAGHNLCGTNAATQATVANMGGTLTITNSTATIGHISMVADTSDDEAATFAVYSADGTLNITAGYIDGAVVGIDADDDGNPAVINLTGGSYVAADGDADAFYLASYVSEGYTASYADNYWNVTSGEDPIPEKTYTVTVTAEAGTTVEGAPTEKVKANTEVTLTVGLEDGYKNLKVMVDGEAVAPTDNKVVITVTADTVVVLSATAMTVYTVSTAETLGDNVKSITATPNIIREDAASKKVKLTAEFAQGYELDYFTVDGVEIEDDEFDISASVVVNAVAKKSEDTKDYPAYIDEADKAKYDAWVEAYKVTDRKDTAAALQDAYLLNVDPAKAEAEAAKFAITAITVSGNTATVTAPTKNSEGNPFNGTVEIKGSATLSGEYTLPADSATARFFKAYLK